jgi:hypothetical protein
MNYGEDVNGDLLADSHILNRWKPLSILNVYQKGVYCMGIRVYNNLFGFLLICIDLIEIIILNYDISHSYVKVEVGYTRH